MEWGKCQSSFLHALTIFVFVLKEHIRDSCRHGNCRASEVQGIGGVTKLSLKKSSAIAFIEKTKKEQGQHQPDSPHIHLPQGLTRNDLYEQYVEGLPLYNASRLMVSLPYWYSIWSANFKDLKCPKVCKFAECKVCATAKLQKQVAPPEMRGIFFPSRTFLLDTLMLTACSSCDWIVLSGLHPSFS